MPTTATAPDAPQKHRVKTASRMGAAAGLSVRLRRAWFAEGDAPANPAPNTPPAPGTQSPPALQLPANIGDDTDISQLPPQVQAYIKSLREENKERRLAAKKAEDERAAAEQKRLAEQGEWKTLAEQRAAELESLKAEKARADALEGQIKAMNESRIKLVPEAMRGIIPTDYTPEKLSAWLDNNLQLLTKAPAPGLDAGQRGERGKIPPDPKSTIKKTSY